MSRQAASSYSDHKPQIPRGNHSLKDLPGHSLKDLLGLADRRASASRLCWDSPMQETRSLAKTAANHSSLNSFQKAY